MAKKLSVFQKFMLLVNYLFIIALIFAYLANIVNPNFVVIFQFFGLMFPAIVIGNLFFVVYWMWSRKFYFFYSLLALFLSLGMIKRVWNFGKKTTQVYTKQLYLLSYNVRLFNLYKWLNEDYTFNEIVSFIEENNFDLICFQEYYENEKINNVDILEKIYPYYAVSSKSDSYKFGLITFSNFLIQRKGILSLKDNKFAIWTDIVVGDFKFRVINVHLKSVNLSYDDYVAIDSLKFDNRRVDKIFTKMIKGYKIRAKQVNMLTNLIDTTKIPIILCGDFNDTPISYTYSKIAKRLKDVFLISGQGMSRTYFKFLPLRIDYIFISPSLQAIEYKRISKLYSDHYPITAKIAY